MNHRELYFMMFNRITDVIEELQSLQRQAEELYIEYEESVEKEGGALVCDEKGECGAN